MPPLRPFPAIALIAATALVLGLAAGSARAQPADTTGAAPTASSHSPRGALWRAAVAPGWGQLYNRQAYKLPVVYAALGGVAGMAVYTARNHRRYDRAYLFVEPKLRDDDDLPLYPQYETDYLALLDDLGLSVEQAATRQAQLAAGFKQTRNNLRRNRDLLFIGVGLVYGLTVLDAYVNAHLLDFDVSEDLSVGVAPHPEGLTAHLRLRW